MEAELDRWFTLIGGIITGLIPAIISARITKRRLESESQVMGAESAKKLAEAAAQLSESQSRVIIETYARLEKEIANLRLRIVNLEKEREEWRKRERRLLGFIETLRSVIKDLQSQIIGLGHTPVSDMPEMSKGN